MTTFYINMVVGDKYSYVATTNDIEMGGFVDADPDNFGFDTIDEAEEAKKELEEYAQAKGYVKVKFFIEEETL